MIVAFRHQRGGMAQVASGRDRRGTSQCAIRPCRQGLDHRAANIAWHLQHYYGVRVSPASIYRHASAAALSLVTTALIVAQRVFLRAVGTLSAHQALGDRPERKSVATLGDGAAGDLHR
jgi:hypothetical protein